MKQILISLIFVAVIYPKYPPMFEGMIMRCEPTGICHWECEFGIEVSTTMVHQNLVVEPAGCRKEQRNSIFIQPSYLQGIRGL